MSPRLFGWWRFAEAITERFASPPADIARADEAACAAVRDSRLFHAVRRFARPLEISWRHSRSRCVADWVACRWRGGSLDSRIRATGRIALVAGSTTVLLQLSLPDPFNDGRPFAWALPLGSALAGLFAVAAGDSIARAWKARREHSPQ
jgi:hypothetical protein